MPEFTFPTWVSATKTTVITKINDAKAALEDYLGNLSPEERKTLFKPSDRRDVFMQKASAAIHTYEDLMPEDVKVDKLDNVSAIRKDFQEIILNLMPLWEGLNDSTMIAGIQELNICNKGYSHLQIAAKSDAAIDTLVEDMGKTYKPGPKQEPTKLGVPISASIAQKGIKPGTRITNLGTTVITCKCGNDLLGTPKEFEDIDIAPGDSFKLPKGVGSVVIVNKSGTTAGLVSFKLK